MKLTNQNCGSIQSESTPVECVSALDATWCVLRREVYVLGEKPLVCLLCHREDLALEEGVAYAVLLYRAQELSCVLSDMSEAESLRIFDVLVTYAVSPIHVRDIWEDMDMAGHLTEM